jgi:hypothetical protein
MSAGGGGASRARRAVAAPVAAPVAVAAPAAAPEPVECTLEECVGACGLWHKCTYGGGHVANTLLPVASFVADGKLYILCNACRAYKAKNRAGPKGRGGQRAAVKASRAGAVKGRCCFVHETFERDFMVDEFLRYFATLGLGPNDAIYFLEGKTLPSNADAALCLKVIREEAVGFLTSRGGAGKNKVATKPDGKHYAVEEFWELAGAFASVHALYFTDIGDGGGQRYVEGELIRRFAESCGGCGVASGGAVLNQSDAPGGGMPDPGFFQYVGALVIRGGLQALGAVLRDSAGNDVSGWRGGPVRARDGSLANGVVRARVPHFVVPAPRGDGYQPRPSGASYLRLGMTQAELFAAAPVRLAKFAALHSLVRYAYEKYVLDDEELAGAPLESVVGEGGEGDEGGGGAGAGAGGFDGGAGGGHGSGVGEEGDFEEGEEGDFGEYDAADFEGGAGDVEGGGGYGGDDEDL